MVKKSQGKGNAKLAAKGTAKGTRSKKKENYAYDEEKVSNKMRAFGEDDDGNDSDEGVAKKDDESVSDDGSDIGWDTDDEIAFGTVVNKSKGKEEEVPVDDESESDDDGGMLLSDMVSGTIPTRTKITSANEEEEGEENEEENEEEDEEGEEEEGEGEDEEEEEEEEDEELEEVHSRLLSAIDKFANQNEGDKGTGVSQNQQAPESAYGGTSREADSTTVSMDALLGALDESKTKGLNVVKARLNSLEKGMEAPKYVEKVHSDRAERKVSYAGTQEEMNKWQDLVVRNRSARTLDIAQDKRVVPKYRDLVRKFEPRAGGMEEEIEMVLVQNNATDKTRAAKEEEDDELGGRKLTVAELRERQAELAKTKALLFYEQMKRHRINKIKSKSFHRIKKRQRLRKEAAEEKHLQEVDPEGYAKQQEEAATARVRERMSLKHRSTSTFAKKMLQHSHGNKSMREAYNESVALGNELKEKIKGGGDGQSDEDGDVYGSLDESSTDDDDDDESMEGAGAAAKKKRRKKVSHLAAKALHASHILDSSGDVAPEVSGKYKKLFDMDFMKRAQEVQREKAREDAQDVLRELEEMERGSDSDGGSLDGRGHKGGGEVEMEAEKNLKKERLKHAKAEIAGLLSGSGGMRLKRGSVFSSSQQHLQQGDDRRVGDVEGVGEGERQGEGEGEGGENPWLLAPRSERDHASQSGKKKASTAVDRKAGAGKAKKNRTGGENEIYVSLDSLVKGPTRNGTTSAKGDTCDKEAATGDKVTGDKVTGMQIKEKEQEQEKPTKKARKALVDAQSQEALVNQVFAGPDFQADFEKYREGVIEEELGIDSKKAQIAKDVKAGWGDWAGPGKEVSQKILSKRDKLIAAAEAEAAQKKKGRKDTRMPNVVLSERRVKTSAKFKLDGIPHPFTTREEYEQSLRMPVGEEWNASHVVRANTKPEVMLRAGRVVEPAKLSKKVTQEAKDKRLSAGLASSSVTSTKLKTTGNKQGQNKRKFKG